MDILYYHKWCHSLCCIFGPEHGGDVENGKLGHLPDLVLVLPKHGPDFWDVPAEADLQVDVAFLKETSLIMPFMILP